MQNSTAYLLFALGQAALAAYLLGLWRKRRDSYLFPLLLPMAAVVYDNLMISFGSHFEIYSSFEFLSRLRFLGHAVFTPLWIVGAVGLLLAAIGAKRTKMGLLRASWLLYGLMVVIGLVNEVLSFKGERVVEGDVVYLTNIGRLMSPPPPSLTMLLVSLACGLLLVVKAQIPWLLVGATAVLAAQAVRGSEVAFVLVNSAELVMAAGIAATACSVRSRTRETAL